MSAFRVQWFRASASKSRWEEEVRILEEEMKRSVRFYMYYKRWWERRAREEEKLVRLGRAATAWRYVLVSSCLVLAVNAWYTQGRGPIRKPLDALSGALRWFRGSGKLCKIYRSDATYVFDIGHRGVPLHMIARDATRLITRRVSCRHARATVTRTRRRRTANEDRQGRYRLIGRRKKIWHRTTVPHENGGIFGAMDRAPLVFQHLGGLLLQQSRPTLLQHCSRASL